MSEQLIISNGVTIHTLNPHNMALKNDYMENLLTTAFVVFPVAARIIGLEKKIIIKRGFLSHAYIMQELSSTANAELLKHSRGMAVEFTWSGWTEEDARLIANELFDEAKDNIKIVFDIKNKSLYVSRDWNQSLLIERTNNENRIVRERAA